MDEIEEIRWHVYNYRKIFKQTNIFLQSYRSY